MAPCLTGAGAHALPVGGDDHRQVHASDGDPVLVTRLVEQERDLVPGGSTLEVDQEEDLVLLLKALHGFEDLCPEVVWPHLGHERHCGDILLGAEDHLAGHLDALGERPVTG